MATVEEILDLLFHPLTKVTTGPYLLHRYLLFIFGLQPTTRASLLPRSTTIASLLPRSSSSIYHCSFTSSSIYHHLPSTQVYDFFLSVDTS
ncbi:hypothetical protein YC2023_036345 [Brassica napus]